MNGRGARASAQRFPTARDALEDRVNGLHEGADDSLVKPFELPELVAHRHALVHRRRSADASVMGFGRL